MVLRLFHVSEEAGIDRFAPRPSPSPDAGVRGDAVWAVDEAHLANFLLPRECPRICFRAKVDTLPEHCSLLGGAEQVVAFEAVWLDRVRACTLQIYEFSPESFTLALPDAGYWIARQAVAPIAVRSQSHLVAALALASAQVRVLEDFWPLADAVAASTLEYSIIRKRNAAPRR